MTTSPAPLPRRRLRGAPALGLVLSLSLTACATREPGSAGDPLEPANRKVFSFNVAADDAVIRPLAVGYRDTVPDYARNRVHAFLDNLQEPRIFANNLLQLRLLDAGHTVMRFFFNSTVGLAGLYDVATPWGIAQRRGDFGQTLYSWGIGDGPYLMLPLAGPSNARDTLGWVGDVALNPLNWLLPLEANLGRGAAEGLDLRTENIEGLDELRRGSLDYYARLRNVWQQRRDAELGRGGMAEDAPEVLEDPGATPAATVTP